MSDFFCTFALNLENNIINPINIKNYDNNNSPIHHFNNAV